MVFRVGFVGLSLAAVVRVGGGLPMQELPAATRIHGGFGLIDEHASRLLVMPTLARPELLQTAICHGGRRVAVQFERRQPGSENNGRQTARNFDTLAGNVYVARSKGVDPRSPCFVASDALLAGSTILTIGSPAGSGACLHRDRFASARRRPVVNCWPIATVGLDKPVALLEFERRGKDALAALVLVDGARSMFMDYPAEFKADGQNLWRVDDGGALSPDGIKVIAALQRGNWWALATAWAGAEGNLLSLWIADGRDRFTKVLNDYWYHAAIAPTRH